MAEAGYSGTPLPKKLGLKDGQAIAILNCPDGLVSLKTSARFASCDDELSDQTDFDFVQIFSKSRDELENLLARARTAIKPGGMIWACWPKKASKVPTDITEDTIRELAFPLDLVDVKVCAVDSVWSGLKIMIRKEKR